MFKTIPLHITPSPEDIEAHARAQLQLRERLEAHAALTRRMVAGRASNATADEVLRNQHLSRVLAGPVPLYRTQRGRARVAMLLAVALLAGCSVTLYSREWISRAACDAMPEVEARALTGCRAHDYAESCTDAQ